MYNITKGYTVGHGGNHDGWDFGAPSHTPLVSLTGGKVTQHTGWYPWGGEIDTKGGIAGQGTTETFAHADRIDVRPGDLVFPGQQVGLSGGEGLPHQYSDGPHVHYSLFGGAPWDNTRSIDPGNFLTDIRKNWGVGGELGSTGFDPGDVGFALGKLTETVEATYQKAETALAQTIKRAGYFFLGLVLVGLGLLLLMLAIQGKIRQAAQPYAEKAAKVAAVV